MQCIFCSKHHPVPTLVSVVIDSLLAYDFTDAPGGGVGLEFHLPEPVTCMDEALDHIGIGFLFGEDMWHQSRIQVYFNLSFESGQLEFPTLVGIDCFRILPDAFMRGKQDSQRNGQDFPGIQHINNACIQQQGEDEQQNPHVDGLIHQSNEKTTAPVQLDSVVNESLRSSLHLPKKMSHENDLRSILRLQLPTDPRWVDLASMSLEEILTDHAYCEQKAATSCISLIQGHPDREDLVRVLAPVVTEEWGHFRQVLAELEKRGLKLGRQRKDEYVNALLAFQRKGGHPEDRFLDKLLTCALIEARSCERFKRLSEGLDDPYMRNFYRKFMESEAGHYTLFINLADQYIGKEKVRARWHEWLSYEAEVLKGMELRGDRMH